MFQLSNYSPLQIDMTVLIEIILLRGRICTQKSFALKTKKSLSSIYNSIIIKQGVESDVSMYRHIQDLNIFLYKRSCEVTLQQPSVSQFVCIFRQRVYGLCSIDIFKTLDIFFFIKSDSTFQYRYVCSCRQLKCPNI